MRSCQTVTVHGGVGPNRPGRYRNRYRNPIASIAESGPLQFNWVSTSDSSVGFSFEARPTWILPSGSFRARPQRNKKVLTRPKNKGHSCLCILVGALPYGIHGKLLWINSPFRKSRDIFELFPAPRKNAHCSDDRFCKPPNPTQT